ncbi:DUF4350 domain-containing protein [Planosporangium thailandense]|uniref:DUF4350 domain-containing protein n=1 Tax=Planosporangium thailandense TaxID=765197 RepID=A0ABX0Y283_9ACTN|nr:DUF4350 domain-containing protein [Planosporangium thailandense]NJC71544.1 DUF4350 domain-containing protein [Planosporangium thailandense]
MSVIAPRPAAPTPATPTPAGVPGAPPRRRRLRWLRLVTPLALVVALVAVSAVAYALQQPDQSDPAYLSPASSAPTGAARLARLVERRGVRVERATRTSDALVSAYRGDATLLVPAPALVHPYYLRMLKLMPASTRIVLVAPSDRALAAGNLPVAVTSRRWATAVGPPGCDLPAAANAGAAAVRRAVLFTVPAPDTTELHRCYAGGLVELSWHDTRLTVIGADDAFRNDRIGEHGNADLATALLTGADRLVWLDVHRLEPRPGFNAGGAPDNAPPSLGPNGSPDPDFPLPGTAHPAPGTNRDSGGGGPSLWSAFPAAAWVTLALLLAAGALLAAARARRLGTPIPEPLPVSVPAAETVLGRGRLYRRAKARDTALETLRAATDERLRRLLDLPPDAPAETLEAAAAARSGWTATDVRTALRPPTPDDDEQFVAAAANLDRLLRAVRAYPIEESLR